MGCVGSSQAADEQPDENDNDVRRQRRRLSVAPQQVPTKMNDNLASVEDEELNELELKAKGDLDCAMQTRKGFVPYNRNKVNQDRAIIKFGLQDDADINMFGVMDGHGEFGHYVASFVQETLPRCIAKQENLKSNTPQAILNGTAKCVAELRENDTINISFSGTTAVYAVKVGSTLYSANIGDSRCVMCRQSSSGKYKAIDLSNDQKPENPEEKARILRAGGRVEPLPGPPGEDCGPPRVWLAEVDVPGLAMSRSIGDEVSQTVGVTSIPEIIEHKIRDDDIFCIWASDGVWEFLSSKQACDIVWKFLPDLNHAAEQLVLEANNRWREEEEVVDDITCVIVQFNKAK